ncbi:hypothetical protein PTTG_26033 [Puccinia triticina 1-1 BBBD Race 1]|uniref:Uncharacterized protein n=1 Tax=Puccinia triticina (isolate 1-1 / race 1 (BBBD)) TaxID=630390 RepID=A0A180GYP2_PUCT1|nr:hypothetical protein PTTG_26033 [Puccinia triticina 1-1 BBBD Race 1]
MQHTRLPRVFHDWIVDRVDQGLGWKDIKILLASPDIEILCDTGVALAESAGVFYNLVYNLIKVWRTRLARRNPDVYVSLALWQSHLTGNGWHNFCPSISDSDSFLFAIQSPWQRQMMIPHGKTMLFVDATHNSVKNCFLSNGRKAELN